MDLKSPYTNITNNESIEAVKEKLDGQNNKSIATKVIRFLFLILTLNNSIFNGINYLQIKTCAMGTIYVPSYANIFMEKFESAHIYPYIRDKTTMYLQYRDLFFIWKGREEELISFIEDPNKKYPSVKFGFKYSKTEIEFLDTKIYKDTNGKLCLAIYHKPKDWQKLLPFQTSQFVIFEEKYSILPSTLHFKQLF